MTRLIYHPIEASTTTVSPIDSTIIDMVTSKPIKIACPYLARMPLQRMIDQCDGWQLLTDVEELLRSQGRSDREWFVQFLTKNNKHIRHCRRLHAKVIVARPQALVGSANFTLSGLNRRAEMSVLLSDQKTVDELETWFDDLWSHCSQIEGEAIANFADSIPDHPSTDSDPVSLSLPTGPQINATLKPVTTMRDGRWTEEAYLALVAEKWPNLLDSHTELLDSLKEVDAIRFSGNGLKEATYHAILPGSGTDMLWIYAHGPIYARWGKLQKPAATRYQELWGNLIDTSHPDGSAKNDGCYLDGGIENVEADQIVQTILAMQDTVNPKAASLSQDERRALAVNFLKSNKGREFTPVEIRSRTGVPKAVVFKLLDGVPGVVITEKSGKRFYSYDG